MPKQTSAARRTSIAGLLAATSLALALSGCATYDVTAPADARADAPAAAVQAKDAQLAAAKGAKNEDGKNGDAKGSQGGGQATAPGGAGDVDCRKAKCVALTFDAGPSENTPACWTSSRRRRCTRPSSCSARTTSTNAPPR